MRLQIVAFVISFLSVARAVPTSQIPDEKQNFPWPSPAPGDGSEELEPTPSFPFNHATQSSQLPEPSDLHFPGLGDEGEVQGLSSMETPWIELMRKLLGQHRAEETS